MKKIDVRVQRSVLSIIGALLVLMVTSAGYSAEVTLTAPQGGATVSGTTPITVTRASNVSWANFYVDGHYEASTGPNTWDWNTTSYSEGSHTVSVNGYGAGGGLLGSASVTVTVSNNPGGGSGWQVPPSATISGLTGSASGISGADTNPAHYGDYTGWGDGYGLGSRPVVNNY